MIMPKIYRYYAFEESRCQLFHEDEFNNIEEAIDILNCGELKTTHIAYIDEIKFGKIIKSWSLDKDKRMSLNFERK